MIPPKAIKKVKNEIHLEIAAGSLIAYGVFPQTNEGIQQAKETAASKDTWLAPSDLPEYYKDIDNDLLIGNETEGIRAIRRHLKEFYGISSARAEVPVDTRSLRPATPAGIQIQWFSLNQVGLSVWERLKAQLIGKGYFSEVNLPEKDADELIENIKKSGEFPSLEDQSGIHNEVYQNWLVDTYLPNYGKTQVYNPGDKFVDDGKEFADKLIDDLDVALEETSNEIEDSIDAILEADKKKYEDFKKQLNRKVNHPKLYKELQHIKPRYMWGQNGLYDLVFKSDIDRAIYFAGKLGGDKDSPIKKAVREWIFAVTGLNIYDDYEEIKEYREKIKAFILQLIKLHPDETEVIVPPIYDGAFDEPDQEEEYENEDDDEMDDEEEMDEEDEEEDDEEYDDLYGSSLDDLLEDVRDKEADDPEEVADQIEEKKEELEAAVEEQPVEDDDEDMGSEDDIPDELLQDDVDPSVLEEIINKKKGKTGTKERKSYYVSNTKLLQGITKSLAAVTGQLEQVNQSLLEQNDLIRANIEISTASLEALQAQDDILATKFDAILNAFQKQYEQSEKAREDAERLRAEQKLEGQSNAAGAEIPESLSKNKDKNTRTNLIQQYYRQKLIRNLYRKLPRRIRSLRTKGRNLQRIPGKYVDRIKNSAANRISRVLPKRVSNFGSNIIQARSAANQLGGISKVKNIGRNVPGLKQALAVWEYGDRKASGQTDTQAMIGVGGGLAGAAAGAAIGTMLFPGVGTLAGLLIGAAFSAAGSYAGSKIADKFTGVDNKKYEQGTNLAQPGTAILHGTEMLIEKDANKGSSYNPLREAGSSLVTASMKYVGNLGPAGSTIAPTIKQKATPLIEHFGISPTLVKINPGGSFSSLTGAAKELNKYKSTSTKDENYTMEEKDLMNTGDSESFADKLLKMLDPKNIFDDILSKLTRPRTDDDHFIPLTEGGYATFGETGSGSNAPNWVHGHFQNSNSKSELLRDTFPFVRKLLDQGSEVVITGGVDRPLNKDMDDTTVKEMISKGIDTHSNRTKGYFAVDVSVKKGTKVPFALTDVRDTGGAEGVRGMIPGTNTFIGHLTRDSKSGGPAPSPIANKPTGSYDIIIPLDHVKPGNQSKIPDKRGGNTFENASATGAAGRERDHQDKAAAKIKAKLEKKGLRVKIITPEDFGNYEDYDNYIRSQSAQGTRIVPIHFDAAVGQGGTGFLTRTKAGDSADAALAKPIQAALSTFQRSNPSLGNLGPTDTVSNATINRAAAAPATLIELGSMVAWEKHDKNFTNSAKFDQLATSVANAIYTGGQFQATPPSNNNRIESLQGSDKNEDTKFLIVNQQSKPPDLKQLGSNNDVFFKSYGKGRWISTNELNSQVRKLYMQRLAQ